jgi:hypothetical protein
MMNVREGNDFGRGMAHDVMPVFWRVVVAVGGLGGGMAADVHASPVSRRAGGDY